MLVWLRWLHLIGFLEYIHGRRTTTVKQIPAKENERIISTSELLKAGQAREESWGFPALRIIKVGPEVGNMVQVETGLTKGEFVVSHPADTMSDGLFVK